MGAWKYPQILILLLAFVYGAHQLYDYWSTPASHPTGSRTIGECTATLWHGAIEPGKRVTLRLRLADTACWQSVREAHLRLLTRDGWASAPARLSGNRNHLTTAVVLPDGTLPPIQVIVILTQWDGRALTVPWHLAPALKGKRTWSTCQAHRRASTGNSTSFWGRVGRKPRQVGRGEP